MANNLNEFCNEELTSGLNKVTDAVARGCYEQGYYKGRKDGIIYSVFASVVIATMSTFLGWAAYTHVTNMQNQVKQSSEQSHQLQLTKLSLQNKLGER